MNDDELFPDDGDCFDDQEDYWSIRKDSRREFRILGS